MVSETEVGIHWVLRDSVLIYSFKYLLKALLSVRHRGLPSESLQQNEQDGQTSHQFLSLIIVGNYDDSKNNKQYPCL